MRRAPLPQDLASLIHHVELFKAGWRERAIRHLLVATISEYPMGVSKDDVYTSVNEKLTGPIAPAEVQRQLDSLRSKGSIVALPVGHLKLSEETQATIDETLAAASERAMSVRKHFDRAFRGLSPNVTITWDDFLQSLLIPLVSELGAKTYQTLTGNDVSIEEASSYADFLERFSEEHRIAVCESISQFMDPSSLVVRQYVLRLLHTAFLVRALTLPAGAVQDLLGRTRKPLAMRIFVDTNFLFSLLGLHINPGDDVVHALHELIDKMPSRVRIKLYMLPCTMDEAHQAIARQKDHLSSFYMSRRVAEALRTGTLDLSGIALTYIRNAYAGGQRISAEDYFAPYLTRPKTSE